MADDPNTSIKIRPETRESLDRICAIKGWNLIEAADRAAKAIIKIDPELAPLRAKQPTP